MFSDEIKEKLARLGGNWMEGETLKNYEEVREPKEIKDSWDPLKSMKDEMEMEDLEKSQLRSLSNTPFAEKSFCSPKKAIEYEKLLFGPNKEILDEEESEDTKRYFLEKREFKQPLPTSGENNKPKSPKRHKRLVLRVGKTILRDESVTSEVEKKQENLKDLFECTVLNKMDEMLENLGSSSKKGRLVMGRMCGDEVAEMMKLIKKKRDREGKREKWI